MGPDRAAAEQERAEGRMGPDRAAAEQERAEGRLGPDRAAAEQERAEGHRSIARLFVLQEYADASSRPKREAKRGGQNPAGERLLQAGVETVASHAQRTDALPVVLIETGFFRPGPATGGRQKQPQRPAQSACLVLTETARSNPEAVEKLQTRQAKEPEVVLPRCVAWERVQEKLTCRALSSKGNGLHKTQRHFARFLPGLWDVNCLLDLKGVFLQAAQGNPDPLLQELARTSA
eukprot:s1203_g17.t1